MLHLSVIEHYEVTHFHKHTPVNTEVINQNLGRDRGDFMTFFILHRE